jgi:hypothetical protein
MRKEEFGHETELTLSVVANTRTLKNVSLGIVHGHKLLGVVLE